MEYYSVMKSSKVLILKDTREKLNTLCKPKKPDTEGISSVSVIWNSGERQKAI